MAAQSSEEKSLVASSWFASLESGSVAPVQVDVGPAGVFARLKQSVDWMNYTPVRHEKVVHAELSDRNGIYHVLKQPLQHRYIRLSKEQFTLWEKMTGEYTVQGLIVEHFMETGVFAHATVLRLVQMLHNEYMLADEPQRIWGRLRQAVAARSWASRLMKPAGSLITMKFGVRGIDSLVAKLYSVIGWLFFTRPAQILFVLISAAGLYGAGRVIGDPSYEFIGSQWVSSLALIWLASLLPVIIHELGHALTVKHYGREVPEGGLMLYLGMPAAYVNTTDMWLEGRRGRLNVTWNGPYTGLVIGGLCSLFILFLPTHPAASFLFKMMGIAYLTVFMNVNPLLKFDGYYLLSDALEIPGLRERSLSFIRTRLFPKLGSREKFSREEIVFAIYGLLSAIWLVYALFLMGNFWQTRIRSGIQVLLGDGYTLLARLFSGLIVAALVALSVLLGIQFVRFIQALLNNYMRRGGLRKHGQLALHLGAVAILFWLAVTWLLDGGPTRAAGLVGALVLGATALLILRFNQAYRGSVRGAAHFAIGVALASASARFLLPMFSVSPGLFGLADAVLLITLCTGGLLFIHQPIERVSPRAALVGLVLGGLTFFGMRQLLPGVQSVWWLALPAAIGWWSAASVAGGARQPALALLFIGGFVFLTPTPFLPAVYGTDLLGGLLLAAGGLHLALARLPELTRLTVSDLPSTTEDATGAAVASILVRRVIAQVFFEGGWPGVGVFGRAFTHSMKEQGLQLEIRRNEWIDPAMGARSTVQFAEIYAIALDRLYELLRSELGTNLGRATFNLGMDLIPWELREVVVELFAGRSSWGAMLNKSLADEKTLRLTLLRRVPMFMNASDDELHQLAAIFATEYFNAGEAIVNQGEAGDKFYLLQRGTAEVWIADTSGPAARVNQLGPGQFFGETALIAEKPRNATIIANTPVQALSLRRDDFNRLVRGRLDSQQASSNQLRNQWVLRSMPLFDELEGIDMAFLAALLKTESYKAGDVVIREGDEGDKFFIVESGELVVTHSRAGRTAELSRRKAGDYFGEIALLEKRPRTATVTALTDVVLLSLQAEDFYDTIPNFMKMRETLESSSSRRLNKILRTDRELSANPVPLESV